MYQSYLEQRTYWHVMPSPTCDTELVLAIEVLLANLVVLTIVLQLVLVLAAARPFVLTLEMPRGENGRRSQLEALSEMYIHRQSLPYADSYQAERTRRVCRLHASSKLKKKPCMYKVT